MKDKRARQLAPGLPADYVAVGLVDRLADEPGMRDAVEAVIRRAGERSGVVLVAEPRCAEWAGRLAGGRIQAMSLEPANAKATASAIMAAARAYLGPSGWMAYAAAAYGKPAICLRGGEDERELIDLAAASRLFSPAPLLIDLADIQATRAGLELIVAGQVQAGPVD